MEPHSDDVNVKIWYITTDNNNPSMRHCFFYCSPFPWQIHSFITPTRIHADVSISNKLIILGLMVDVYAWYRSTFVILFVWVDLIIYSRLCELLYSKGWNTFIASDYCIEAILLYRRCYLTILCLLEIYMIIAYRINAT